MAYVSPNFKTKKSLKEAVAAGMFVTVFQPNGDLCGVVIPLNGTASIEGPHYPQPHTWCAIVTIADGRVVKVK